MDTQQKARATPQDFFMHLFSIIALYVSAGAFLAIVFQIIHIYIPDILDATRPYGMSGDTDFRMATLRSSLSLLIIFFPAYVASCWHLNRMYIRTPEKQQLWIRRWLIYFTLFVAALVILGDLVSLVNSVLNGETRMRFYLKVFAVFFVAGSIFLYYLWDIRRICAQKNDSQAV